MEFGSKLEDMNLTSDEMSRLGKALKDETFRKLLHDYAEEISNPENKKRYEEEIKQLEQERGMDVQFIHPKPFRVLKTSDGKQKCFINICSNELIRTAECKPGGGEDGRRGLHWSLPYSLAPGRPDVDSNGNKHILYDVVFHPDTLHMTSRNARFMELVDNTAMDGIQESFKVKLDRKNTKILKTKYKGVPHAAVIRRATSGLPRKQNDTDKNDPLAFPYPYDKAETSSTLSNVKRNSSGDQSTQTKPTKAVETCSSEKQPTEPHYTVKYRSVVDLQDYRCSRDSAPSPRPREIVIAIDLPLLKSAADADLDVTEKQIVLKSSKPAYMLELDLAYPVDENKGQAKFNKQKKQLVVTLPVLPLKEPLLTAESPELVGDTEEQLNGPSAEEEREKTSTTENSLQTHEHTCVEADAEQPGLDVQCVDNVNVPDCSRLPELRLHVQEWRSSSADVQEDTPLSPDLTSAEYFTDNTEEESVHETRTTKEEVETFIAATATSLVEDTLEKIPDNEEETQSTNESTMEDEEQEDSCSQVDMLTYVQAKKTVRFSEMVSVAEEEDEDDLPEEQSCNSTRPKQPSAVLREINPEDGTEVIISDHTTSSAFVFQNSLLYELD